MRKLITGLGVMAFMAWPVVALANDGGNHPDHHSHHHGSDHPDHHTSDHPDHHSRHHASGDDGDNDQVENAPGDDSGSGTSALKHVAIRQCDLERASLGRDAFRSKWGPGPFHRCVALNMVGDVAALNQCVAERTALGVTAFRAKYGSTHHALRNCIKLKTGTP